jgi:hypothetical protein
MTGPNNYKNRDNRLLEFVRQNPGLRREEILCRLGHDYLYAFNVCKTHKWIVLTPESTYRNRHWIVKGG